MGLDYAKHYAEEEAEGLRRSEETFQVYRLRSTLQYVPEDARSLLDVGAGEGHWLAYADRHRSIDRVLGVEVASNRVDAAREMYPALDLQCGDIFELELEETFDVVTCLEVIEHLHDWKAAVERLISLARRKVVITVPFREKIQKSVCVHCHRATPHWGHLHRFDEHSFDYLRSRCPVEIGTIPGEAPNFGLRHLYNRLLAPPQWMAVVLHLDQERPSQKSQPTRLLSDVKERALGLLPRDLLY